MCSMDVACMENADHSAPGDQEFRVAGPIHLLQLPLIVALATGAKPPAPDGDGVATLDAVVVVVSSRVPEPLSQVVASVAQVEREELDRHLVRDPEGLVRYMPGVEVVSEGNRFGTRGFSIRGLEGNRVRIVVDGVQLADAYSIGQFASAGRDLVALEAVERGEITRGPASPLDGKDALAGEVASLPLHPAAPLMRGAGARALRQRPWA